MEPNRFGYITQAKTDYNDLIALNLGPIRFSDRHLVTIEPEHVEINKAYSINESNNIVTPVNFFSSIIADYDLRYCSGVFVPVVASNEVDKSVVSAIGSISGSNFTASNYIKLKVSTEDEASINRVAYAYFEITTESKLRITAYNDSRNTIENAYEELKKHPVIAMKYR